MKFYFITYSLIMKTLIQRIETILRPFNEKEEKHEKLVIFGDLSFYGKTTNILDFVNSHILKVWKLGYGKRIKFFSCWNLVVFFLKKKDQFILYENKSKTIINICSGERQKQAMVRKHLHSSVEIKIEVVNADFPWKSCH